jgi:hypothetical protein
MIFNFIRKTISYDRYTYHAIGTSLKSKNSDFLKLGGLDVETNRDRDRERP